MITTLDCIMRSLIVGVSVISKGGKCYCIFMTQTFRAFSFSSKSTRCVSRLASVEAMLPKMKPNSNFPTTITAMA